MSLNEADPPEEGGAAETGSDPDFEGHYKKECLHWIQTMGPDYMALSDLHNFVHKPDQLDTDTRRKLEERFQGWKPADVQRLLNELDGKKP